MSPRRKSGLSKEDLDALKHLPAVLEAVRKVTALGLDLRAAVGVPSLSTEQVAAQQASRKEGMLTQARQGRTTDWTTLEPPPPVSPTLDTPERREYEEAKKSGKPIPAAPDPFANATPEQKARMEEQRAFLASQGRGRPSQAPRIILTDAEPEPVGEEDVVREETLDTISDGTNQFNPPPEVQ